MVVKILLWAGFSIASGVLYRLGGKGGFRHAKGLRRFGCSLLFLSLFIALRGSQGLNLRAILPYCLIYVLNALALSTYCGSLIGSHDDVEGLEWFFSALLTGLAALPLIWIGVHWYMILARAFLLAISIMVVREKTGKVVIEEVFSGVIYCLSVPLLLI